MQLFPALAMLFHLALVVVGVILVVRFVKAHERIASSLDEIAKRGRGAP